MATTIKAGIIGSGFMGRVHTEAARRLGFVEPIAINSRDSDALKQLWGDSSIQAVHICTPNHSHFSLAKAALDAGKHVLCEKPLATSVADAEALNALASSRGLRNCTCHNLRYYPMVQHMRAMREAGELGEILAVQGTYSQDWLLYETDWNWRIDSEAGGASRALADIGSHWCDMAEHVTGQRITSLIADLQTFHKTRKRPKAEVESFGGKTLAPEDYDSVPVTSEDFASVLIQMGDRTRGAFTASQVSAGRKNRLNIEIFGSKCGVGWDQERPDELWIGNRNSNNQIIVKDPALLKPSAQPFADLPGGHSEGYDDTFKQVFRRFYASIQDFRMEPQYPQFADGLRQLKILDAELGSHASGAWTKVG